MGRQSRSKTVWSRRSRWSSAVRWADQLGSWHNPVPVNQNTLASRIAAAGMSSGVIWRSGALGRR